MSKLNVCEQFAFNFTFRNQFQKTSDSEYSPAQPYERTIFAIKQVCQCESPMSKLELIYTCC